MPRIPMLIDSYHAREKGMDICARIAYRLAQKDLGPLPYASALPCIQTELQNLQRGGARPAIFVVNTLGAGEFLPQLDLVIGETPVLFLRRSLDAGRSGLNRAFTNPPLTKNTTVILKNMRPRLASIWYYGGKTEREVADEAAHAISQFLQDGEFRHVESVYRFQVNPHYNPELA